MPFKAHIQGRRLNLKLWIVKLKSSSRLYSLILCGQLCITAHYLSKLLTHTKILNFSIIFKSSLKKKLCPLFVPKYGLVATIKQNKYDCLSSY